MKAIPFYIRLLGSVFVLIGSISLVNAQEKSSPIQSLEFILEIIGSDFDEKRSALFEKYAGAVDRLQKAFQDKGDLANAVKARKEAENARQSSRIGKEAIPGITRIREIIRIELAKIDRNELPLIIQARKKNIELVKARITNLTKEGKLDEALKMEEATLKPTESALAKDIKNLADMDAGKLIKSSPTTRVRATKESPFENSLGMKFVPVEIPSGPTKGKQILFSIWETRVKEYSLFVRSTKREWRKANVIEPAFKQTDDHPAVWVRGADAIDFCKWLTKKERKKKRIGEKDRYRLPSDHEWSCAVGIGKQENPEKEPMEKNLKIKGVYPWGEKWPPPVNFGNYLGEETKDDLVAKRPPIAGFQDGFRETAPVGSYAPNQFGLYDLGGNVCEWCSDVSEDRQIFRDGGWRHHQKNSLSSSSRTRGASFDHVGFRCVLEIDAGNN